MSKTKTPPGPPGHFLTGHLAELRRDVLALYTRCAREYGEVAQVRFGLRPVWVISNPDLIEEVLASRNFVKHYALRMNRRLLGDGLLSSEGDHWLRQRRLIQPAFLRERIQGYGEVMLDSTRRHAGAWKDGAVQDVHADMRALTLEIAGKTLFGADVAGQGAEVAEALTAVGEGFIRRLFSLIRLPEWVPTPGNLRAGKAIRRLDAILYKIIEKRRAEGLRDDFLSILLHARDEQGGMSDQQVRDEAMTLFLAGHETTALALTYTLHALAHHPEVQDRLREEACRVAPVRDLTVADLPALSYAEMVVLEGMRLYPPAYAIGRQAAAECELGGYTARAGQTVLLVQWVMHRDPRFWEDPERFHPERWADGLAKRLPRGVYFPFGGGPRVCIGNTFALMEATLVLACLARRWRFHPVDGTGQGEESVLRFKPRLTLAPARLVRLRYEAVEQSQ